jgi:hypothetical protein
VERRRNHSQHHPGTEQPRFDLLTHGTACDTIIKVANAQKILARMRANPRDWRIEDLKMLAAHYSIEYRQPGSSHVVFIHRKAGTLTVPAARPIKPVYIRRFVALIDKLEGAE